MSTTNFLVSDGVNPIYDIGDTFISKKYIFAAYPAMSNTIKSAQLFACGRNNSGQLGLNNTNNQSSPTLVGSSVNWRILSDYVHDDSTTIMMATKMDGTLWSWGNFRALGVNGSADRSSPVQLTATADWRQPATGYRIAAAVKNDGSLWTWGDTNAMGQLGISSTVASQVPVRVGLLNNWKQVACGYNEMAAVKTDGTLWTWGANTAGQLGQNNTTAYSSPVQVGSDTNWKAVTIARSNNANISHMIALKNNGTLWSWGSNTFGQLGQNIATSTNVSSPVQIGSDTNWQQIAASYTTGYGIKTDGTLWAWGQNNTGQLGTNDLVNRSSPTQIGSDQNWLYVKPGYFNMYAIKLNGTLWGSGSNLYGQLGQGDTITRSSPVQIGSLTNWKRVYGAGGGFIAISERGGW